MMCFGAERLASTLLIVAGILMGMYGAYLLLSGGSTRTTRWNLGDDYDIWERFINHKSLGRLLGVFKLAEALMLVLGGILTCSISLWFFPGAGVVFFMCEYGQRFYGNKYVIDGSHFHNKNDEV